MINSIKLEIKRNTRKRNIAIFLVFILIVVIINYVSISQYRSAVAKHSSFVDIENKRINKLSNYFDYLQIGFRVLSEPSPFNALSYNSTFGELIGFIENGEKLKIYKPQVGTNAFERPMGENLDLCWLIFIIGGMAVLVYGWSSFADKDYLKFLMSLCSPKTIHAGILMGRIIIIISCLACIILLTGLQMLFSGLLSGGVISGLLSLFLSAMLYLVFLLMVAAALGNLKNRALGISITVFIGFSLLFLWPRIQSSIIYNQSHAEMKSIYEYELQKTDIFINFEKTSVEEMKKLKTMEEINKASRKLAEDFLNNGFKQIENIESEITAKTGRLARKFHLWSIFNPAAFYKSISNELSSRGYNAYLDFYNFVQKRQKEFLRFYINKRFHEKSAKVEPFLKDSEYIYKLESSLPAFFSAGIIYNVLLIVILFFISYLFFKRAMFPVPEYETKDLDFKYVSGKYFAQGYDDPCFPTQLFNLFMGRGLKRKFAGKISLDGENVVTGKRQNFVYLPMPEAIPGDMKTLSLLKFMGDLFKTPKADTAKIKKEFGDIMNKRFEELDKQQKVDILYALTKLTNAGIYLFNDFFSKIAPGSVDKISNELKEQNALIIELFTTSVTHQNYNYYSSITIDDSSYKEKEFNV